MRAGFAPSPDAHDMTWEIADAATPARTLVLVSRLGHCLNDLLYRTRVGTLPITIPAVVSNHDDLRGLVEGAGIAYHHVPVTPAGKADAERRLLDLVHELRIDLVVLARYMQVLSDGRARRWRAARSTSTTRSCPRSSARSRTTRPTCGA